MYYGNVTMTLNMLTQSTMCCHDKSNGSLHVFWEILLKCIFASHTDMLTHGYMLESTNIFDFFVFNQFFLQKMLISQGHDFIHLKYSMFQRAVVNHFEIIFFL